MDPWLEYEWILGLAVEVGISSHKISSDIFILERSKYLHILQTRKTEGFIIRHGGWHIKWTSHTDGIKNGITLEML